MSFNAISPISLNKNIFYFILTSFVSSISLNIITPTFQQTAITIPIKPNQSINTLFGGQQFLNIDDIQFYYQNSLLDKSNFEISGENKEIFFTNSIYDNKYEFEGFQLLNRDEENIYKCSFLSKISEPNYNLIWFDVHNIIQRGKYFFGLNGIDRDHITCFTFDQNGIKYLHENKSDYLIRVSRIFEINDNSLLAIDNKSGVLVLINITIENNVMKPQPNQFFLSQYIDTSKLKNLKLKNNVLFMIMEDQLRIFLKHDNSWEFSEKISKKYNNCEMSEKYLVCFQENKIEFINIYNPQQNAVFEIEEFYPSRLNALLFKKIMKCRKTNSEIDNLCIQIGYIDYDNNLGVKEILVNENENDLIELNHLEKIKEINIPLIATEINVHNFITKNDLSLYFWYNQTDNKYYLYNYVSKNNHHLFTIDSLNDEIPLNRHILTLNNNKNEFALIREGTENLSNLIYGQFVPNQTLNCIFYKEGIITQKITVYHPSSPIIQTTFFHVFEQNNIEKDYNIYKKLFWSICGIVIASIIALIIGYIICYCKRNKIQKNEDINYQMVYNDNKALNLKLENNEEKAEELEKEICSTKQHTVNEYNIIDKPL